MSACCTAGSMSISNDSAAANTARTLYARLMSSRFAASRRSSFIHANFAWDYSLILPHFHNVRLPTLQSSLDRSITIDASRHSKASDRRSRNWNEKFVTRTRTNVFVCHTDLQYDFSGANLSRQMDYVLFCSGVTRGGAGAHRPG